MDDAVEVALRRKRDSSMRVAISAAQGRVLPAYPALQRMPVCRLATPGHLMAVARYVLKTL